MTTKFMIMMRLFIWLATFAMFLVVAPIGVSDTKWSALTAASSVSDSDYTAIVQGGVNKRATFTLIRQITASQITDATTVGRAILSVTNPSAIRFLRVNADNTVTLRTASEFAADIGATGVSDGDKGDITVTGSGATWTIDNDTVALTTKTTGNYVASIATTSPITGGAAGNEGAALTIDLDTTNLGVKGADIASAATTDLSTATGDFVDITGTTTITSFGTVTAGRERVVRFTGALTLTHNATSLILPGGVNITTVANDRAILRSLGSGNWLCVDYIPATITGTGSQVRAASPTFTGTVTAASNALTTSGITSASHLIAASGSLIGWTSRSWLTSPADGTIRLTNNAQTGFTRLSLGGTTSSFPSLEVSGTTINFELADGSAAAAITASIDASTSGTTLKFKSFPQFTSPLRVEGTNATIGITVTDVGYGLVTYSNSADEAANWAEWRILVPADWDTSVVPRVKLADMIGADTGARQYTLSVASVASSASATAPTLGNAIDVNMAADASGAANDIEISSTTTLTGWGSAMTPGRLMVIRVARDGDQATEDASTVNSTLVAFELEYGVTQ